MNVPNAVAEVLVRLPRLASLVVVVIFVVPFAYAQQTSSSSSQAQALLQQSLAALTGGKSITDVTLTGTARRVAGSDDESGSATLKAVASGAARMDLTLPSGPRSEVANLTGSTPAGSWSGPDGRVGQP